MVKVFQENIGTENIHERKLCLKEKHVFNSTVLLRTHLRNSLHRDRMTTWAGPGMLSGVTEGGCGASEEERGGFPFCGSSLVAMNKDRFA